MGLKAKLSLILLAVTLLFFPARASAATVSDLSKQFICQCGCNMVLLNCSHLECGSREAMTDAISQKIAQGQTEEQIVQFFVARYGEQVLASPPKKGFNLMAWFTPFAALLLGVGVIYIALRKWVRRGSHVQAYVPTDAGEVDEKYRRQLEKELEEFAERSFR